MKKHLVLCYPGSLLRGIRTENKNKRHRSAERAKLQMPGGKRAGLITNPTGVDNHMKSTIDICTEVRSVRSCGTHGPQHGVRRTCR